MLLAADGKEKYTFPFAYGSGLKTAPNAPYTATASPSITRPALSLYFFFFYSGKRNVPVEPAKTGSRRRRR